MCQSRPTKNTSCVQQPRPYSRQGHEQKKRRKKAGTQALGPRIELYTQIPRPLFQDETQTTYYSTQQNYAMHNFSVCVITRYARQCSPPHHQNYNCSNDHHVTTSRSAACIQHNTSTIYRLQLANYWTCYLYRQTKAQVSVTATRSAGTDIGLGPTRSSILIAATGITGQRLRYRPTKRCLSAGNS